MFPYFEIKLDGLTAKLRANLELRKLEHTH